MNKKKSTKTTVFLVLVILTLMASSFYISFILSNENSESVPTAPKKIKAADITYTKLIALGEVSVSPGESETVSPTSGEEVSLSPTAEAVSPTVELLPSPTEIILAQGPTTPVGTSSAYNNGITATPSPTTTKLSSLPESGFINNTLVIFAVSSLMIFFSFLF